MNASEAYSRLLNLGVPVIRTSDAAALLGLSTDGANKTLKRLADAGLLVPIRQRVWGVGRNIDPYVLPEYLTAPYPSYLSLQTALYLHGMISQIPEIIFAVSLGRSQRIETRAGIFSIHRVAPELFGGFETSESGVKLATPEKALVDLLYLSGGRSRLFAALPELELPPRFRMREARAWIKRIPAARIRMRVERRLEAITA